MQAGLLATVNEIIMNLTAAGGQIYQKIKQQNEVNDPPISHTMWIVYVSELRDEVCLSVLCMNKNDVSFGGQAIMTISQGVFSQHIKKWMWYYIQKNSV